MSETLMYTASAYRHKTEKIIKQPCVLVETRLNLNRKLWNKLVKFLICIGYLC